MRNSDLIDALQDLIEAERQLVLDGDIQGLERLADRKESLLTHLSAARPDPADLVLLREGLDRNSRILSAAGQGIRHALDRVRQLADPAPLVTYDGQGRRSEMAEPVPSVSRSA